MRLGYRVASEPAIARVDSTNQRRLLFTRAFEAPVSQQLHVTICDVRKRLSRRARVRRGHVRDAIMRHALLDVDWIVMRRRSGGFGAPTLINRNIYEYATAF